MSGSIVPVSRARHGRMAVAGGPDLAAAATLGHVPIGLGEVPLALCDYPLVLLKDGGTGGFRLVALLGFEADRNLFVIGGNWAATYLPLNILRLPFCLAHSDEGALELCVDEASGLIGGAEGSPLFEADGAETQFLANRRALVRQMLADAEATAAFVGAIAAERILTPMTITLHFVDKRQQAIEGAYTIDPLALESLPPEALVRLHAQGHLAPIHAMMHSLGQINRLEQLHNAQSEHRLSASTVQLRL